jgi:DNA replication licensing factor MCM7
MSGRRDYEDDKEKIRQFLEEFTSPDDGTGQKNFKYYDQMVKLAHREQTEIIIELQDIIDYGNEDLAEAVETNASRFVSCQEVLVSRQN